MQLQLSEQERLVYDMVREYLDHNRIFEIEKVNSFIQARFRLASININSDGIEKHLKTLVDHRILVPGSKLIKENVLDNENRNAIFGYVVQNPGIHLKKIITDLGLSINTVAWHITILETFNFISSDQIDNRIIFFDSHLELNKVKIYYFTNHSTSKKILQYLKINDYGISKTQLADELNMHYNTVVKFLDYLSENNLVVSQKEVDKTLYFLNEKYFEMI